jgi:nucleoside 2-deoxyribosyltransferase
LETQPHVKLYLAGPLFTRPEQDWLSQLAVGLRAAGHEVFVPHESQGHPNPTAQQIFERDTEGVDWCEGVVAVMDGSDPDSGTSWECGYAYARQKPIVTFRSDFRQVGEARGVAFNLMLWCSASAHVELPLCSMDEAVSAIAHALSSLPGAQS